MKTATTSWRRWCTRGCWLGVGVAIVLLGNSRPGVSETQIVDRIVAVVNEEVITLSDLNRELAPYAAKIRAQGLSAANQRRALEEMRAKLLSTLIDQRLTDQEIARAGISVSEDDIDRAIARIQAANFASDEEMEASLAAQGLSMEAYRRQIERQMLRSKLLALKIKSKVVITQEDIEACYRERQDEYCGKREVQLAHILLPLPAFADEETRRTVTARAERIMADLAGGADFARLARRYSQGASAAEGGRLGQFALDALAPDLRAAIEPLEAGQYTPVLETDQGLQIFLVENIVQSDPQPLEAVAPEIEEQLYEEFLNVRYDEWLQDLRERAHIRIME